MTQTERTLRWIENRADAQDKRTKEQEDYEESLFLQKSHAYDAYKYTKEEQYY